MSDKNPHPNGTLPEGYYFVDEMNLPGEKERLVREMWCLWTRRDLLPMALPKTDTNTALAQPRNDR